MRRWIWALGASLLLASAVGVAPAAAQQDPQLETERVDPVPTPDPGAPPALGSTAAILVDLDDGRVLLSKQARHRLPPASMTKVVTALVARDLFTLAEEAVVPQDVLQVRGGKLGMEPGMRFTVQQLLYALLLKSANDAGHVLAAHDPHGYDHFIALMNEKARALGAFDTHLVNPHGMDAPEHYSSAWDMAIFGRQLLEDPVLAEIVATPRFTLPWPGGNPRSFDNHNKLLGQEPGTLGIKTGFTNRAGKCLVAAAQLGPGRALTVVMNAPDHYAETVALWNYFSQRPVLLRPADEGSSEDPVLLATPPPAPVTDPVEAALVARAGPVDAPRDVRWVALMAVLAALTLATLQRPQRLHPIAEAAQFHAYLEPLLETDAAWENPAQR
ncbi:MAG TPA: D-alanyl-D-alanine carboxypeptidase family protein [Actinomycetota bacterium]|nr:D-alanyl-D-alanine carboxypeptidase family protein [Actinomycetota bacterium]